MIKSLDSVALVKESCENCPSDPMMYILLLR